MIPQALMKIEVTDAAALTKQGRKQGEHYVAIGHDNANRIIFVNGDGKFDTCNEAQVKFVGMITPAEANKMIHQEAEEIKKVKEDLEKVKDDLAKLQEEAKGKGNTKKTGGGGGGSTKKG